MKKITVTILAISYLILSVGISLDFHFCKEDVILVLNSDDQVACACQQEQEEALCHVEIQSESCCHTPVIQKTKSSCCYDESLEFKYSSEEQLPSKSLELAKIQVVELLQTDYIREELERGFEPTGFDCKDEPPPNEALWLYYQSLTFYG